MFEVGQIFNRDGYEFCVLKIFDFNGKKYILFGVEKEKIEYMFYEVLYNESGYNLRKVVDDETNFALFEFVDYNKED